MSINKYLSTCRFIYTTNTFGDNNDNGDATLNEEHAVTLEKGNMLYIGAKGFLTATKPDNYEGPEFQVVMVYDMPDGQDAVKVMRTK